MDLSYKVINKGSGDSSPSAGDEVEVHYTGKLEDGTVFDSSVERGAPSTFTLIQGSPGVKGVIEGWVEGVQLMVVGDKFEFEIPGNLAYGEQGIPQSWYWTQ